MDWTGNSKSIYSTLGASNHSVSKRADNDYYATHPLATELLMQTVLFADNIWEPCCGGGHMAKVLEAHGYTVKATDLYDRGYGQGGVDFLKCFETWEGDIITNPPYKLAREIAEHALELVTDGHKVAMFLKTTFLEGQARRSFFEKYPPIMLLVSSARLVCAPNGDFKNIKGSAVSYSWFLWEKGFHGAPIIKWIN